MAQLSRWVGNQGWYANADENPTLHHLWNKVSPARNSGIYLHVGFSGIPGTGKSGSMNLLLTCGHSKELPFPSGKGGDHVTLVQVRIRQNSHPTHATIQLEWRPLNEIPDITEEERTVFAEEQAQLKDEILSLFASEVYHEETADEVKEGVEIRKMYTGLCCCSKSSLCEPCRDLFLFLRRVIDGVQAKLLERVKYPNGLLLLRTIDINARLPQTLPREIRQWLRFCDLPGIDFNTSNKRLTALRLKDQAKLDVVAMFAAQGESPFNGMKWQTEVEARVTSAQDERRKCPIFIDAKDCMLKSEAGARASALEAQQVAQSLAGLRIADLMTSEGNEFLEQHDLLHRLSSGMVVWNHWVSAHQRTTIGEEWTLTATARRDWMRSASAAFGIAACRSRVLDIQQFQSELAWSERQNWQDTRAMASQAVLHPTNVTFSHFGVLDCLAKLERFQHTEPAMAEGKAKLQALIKAIGKALAACEPNWGKQLPVVEPDALEALQHVWKDFVKDCFRVLHCLEGAAQHRTEPHREKASAFAVLVREMLTGGRLDVSLDSSVVTLIERLECSVTCRTGKARELRRRLDVGMTEHLPGAPAPMCYFVPFADVRSVWNVYDATTLNQVPKVVSQAAVFAAVKDRLRVCSEPITVPEATSDDTETKTNLPMRVDSSIQPRCAVFEAPQVLVHDNFGKIDSSIPWVLVLAKNHSTVEDCLSLARDAALGSNADVRIGLLVVEYESQGVGCRRGTPWPALPAYEHLRYVRILDVTSFQRAHYLGLRLLMSAFPNLTCVGVTESVCGPVVQRSVDGKLHIVPHALRGWFSMLRSTQEALVSLPTVCGKVVAAVLGKQAGKLRDIWESWNSTASCSRSDELLDILFGDFGGVGLEAEESQAALSALDPQTLLALPARLDEILDAAPAALKADESNKRLFRFISSRGPLQAMTPMAACPVFIVQQRRTDTATALASMPATVVQWHHTGMAVYNVAGVARAHGNYECGDLASFWEACGNEAVAQSRFFPATTRCFLLTMP